MLALLCMHYSLYFYVSSDNTVLPTAALVFRWRSAVQLGFLRPLAATWTAHLISLPPL